MQAVNLFELQLLQGLHRLLQCEFFDHVSVWITLPGNKGLGFILLAVVLLCIPRTRKYGALAATAILLDVLLVNVCIKPLVSRVRPYDLGVALQLLVSGPGDYSFPSGHTAVAFATAFALLPAGKKVFFPMLAYGVLMGFSRLYLMVHYPTDVLGGALCGALCGLAAVWIWKQLGRRWGKAAGQSAEEG